jgi:precorrin-6B methylase 1
MIPDFNLACVGISLQGLGALTFESLAYIASADLVFCYPPSAAHYELIKLLNTNVVNLHETLYVKGSEFDSTYDAIIRKVMDEVRRGVKVAYATQGSPAFHCGTAVSLHRTAKREGFKSVVISGVSSFELLSGALLEDYDITNVQIISVVRLMGGTLEINSKLPCLLFDFGRYALPTIRGDSSMLAPTKLSDLVALLSSIYSPTHKVILMSIPSTGSYCKTTVALTELEHALGRFGPAQTIFVPASR